MSKLLAILLFPVCCCAQVGVEMPILHQGSGSAIFACGLTWPITNTPVLWTDITCGVTNSLGASPPTDCTIPVGWSDVSGNSDPLVNPLTTVNTVYAATTGCDNSATNWPYVETSSTTWGVFTNKSNVTWAQPSSFTFVWYIKFAENTTASWANLNPKSANQFGQLNHATGPNQYHWYCGTDQALTNGTITSQAWVIDTFIYNGASSQIWENGHLKFQGNVGNNGITGLTVGGFFNGSSGTPIFLKHVSVNTVGLNSNDVWTVHQTLYNRFIHSGTLP